MVGILLVVMEENMDVLEDKYKKQQHKLILTIVIALTFILRFLRFYEVPGITIRNGWAAPTQSPLIFVGSVLVFIIGTWCIRTNIFQCILQIGSLISILFCELLFIDYSDYKIEWISYGFWLNLLATILLQIYCIYYYIKKHKF